MINAFTDIQTQKKKVLCRTMGYDEVSVLGGAVSIQLLRVIK